MSCLSLAVIVYPHPQPPLFSMWFSKASIISADFLTCLNKKPLLTSERRRESKMRKRRVNVKRRRGWKWLLERSAREEMGEKKRIVPC